MYIIPFFFFLLLPSTEWRMLRRCYFWRGMKTYFSSLSADDVNFLSEQNMQMKCVNTIK